MDERAEERLELRWIERDDRDDEREHREALTFWEDDGLSHFERVSEETARWSQ